MLPNLSVELNGEFVTIKGIYRWVEVDDKGVVLADKMGSPVQATIKKKLKNELSNFDWPRGERVFCELRSKRVEKAEFIKTDLYTRAAADIQEQMLKMCDDGGKFTPYFRLMSAKSVSDTTLVNIVGAAVSHGSGSGPFEYLAVPNKFLKDQKWLKSFGELLGYVTCGGNAVVAMSNPETGERLATFYEMLQVAKAECGSLKQRDALLMVEVRQTKLADFVGACHDVSTLAFVLKDETYFNIISYEEEEKVTG